MATLTNTRIQDTYTGLIKIEDNGTVDPTVLQQLTDGAGGSLPIQVSQVQTKFQTSVDFTGATVTGLPISPAGLVNGSSGVGSLKAADYLLNDNTGTVASNSLAIGNATECSGGGSTVIGNGSSCNASESVAIGKSASAGPNGPAISIGRNSQASGSVSTAFGNGASVDADNSIAFSGENCSVDGSRSIGIGRQVVIGNGTSNIAIGNLARITGSTAKTILFTASNTQQSDVTASDSVVITPGEYGGLIPSNAANSITIGAATSNLERCQAAGTISIGTDTQASNVNGVCLGTNTSVQADNAAAIGSGVQATIADTVSVNALEVKNNTNGIILYSPDNTAYRVTVANGGTLTVAAV